MKTGDKKANEQCVISGAYNRSETIIKLKIKYYE
jgi:hypothetical protein